MAYAMGRTPKKNQQELEDKIPPRTPDMTEETLRNTEEPVNVRRMTGEWERGKTAPKAKTTPPPPPLKERTNAKTASIAGKVAPPVSEPKSSASRRPSIEAGRSPMETGGKYQSRLTEAKAMMTKVKMQLNSSRNTSKSIIKEVTDAVERLVQLVREAEAGKKPNNNESNKKDQPTGERTGEEAHKAQDKTGLDDRILSIIQQNHKMLMENDRKMVEIKRIMEGNAEKAAYATIAGRKPLKENKNTGRNTLHSIVVTSQDDQETGDEVLAKVRKAMEAKEGWITVERVRKAKDRKIVMGCNTREEREKIRTKLEKAGQRLVVEDMKNKDPLLVLKGVLTNHTDEEVVRALRNQNREVFHGLDDEESRMKVKFRRRTRNPHTSNIVLTVSPIIWGRATERGRLKVDLQNVFVEDQSPLVQCSRCLGYGHSRRYCKTSVEVCSHCGGPHLRTDCPGKVLEETPECVNCKRAGRAETGHNAFSGDCPVRKKWDSIARASIQYC